MGEAAKGFWALVAACTVWGLSPLYYKLLAEVPPLQVLAHRTLWSLAFFGLVVVSSGKLREVRAAFLGRGAAITALSSVLISANWLVFIWAVQVGRTFDASMGYFLFPLVAVVLGVAVLGERLGPLQWLAVALAAAAVALLAFGLGALPWVALTLAVTFGLYGLVKKRLAVSPLVSVTAEVLLLAPLAFGWLGWIATKGGAAMGGDARTLALLAFSGVLTGGPLMLFAYAARRVRMATLGLVQYLNPLLQFLCAVAVFAEPFTPWHRAAFALIWVALALYSGAGLFQPKAVASRDSSAATSGSSST
ncbi:MAG: EamA family transporter RarD [Phaeovulum sp.]|uniref:EamA family transporter RarD n=1 Tax=Phaeovulum sp. TaxID=2934796 RepID=UPI00272F4C8E|nr:EamA family transporter RarD [Phaeovulum sp.]MDP2063035.1 EamA family transporter RarD [Phaeovulum sp.]MDP3861014.1 EamA family transporter RarD [Phaeovulum sp.]